MSEYRTVFRPEAQAGLRKIPRDMALRVLAELTELTELEGDPLGFDTTALVSQPECRRLRVGDYRVIYTIDDGELVVRVVHVGHRSTVHDT
ncbi:type II toxin-antitoxin system RelE family toxin [Streptomyces sudanensis]|uniref:type II toxin-antitoxin system RelE family toxin n=1 Tax=Streptomyces sudanensis TaxID=436397 RepID=UPI0020CF9847|nr:type II toxin-antitoxin system RelE/ParE family toxin [Streptomyces sudanensis]MCP9957488.1 type II toxin-antitoxin system RelE/ParE family toxin [Streptomyces sudanensis]MCP9986626.1 type II toxin-antitoxin system RelE/ParE family toxin [Streptomyces sudanensis]MCQ0001965.1 type II toxin-antitoxin system RelE/ParE family toxin [Streptomyces sudanensis]